MKSLHRSHMPLHSTRPLMRPQLVKTTQCSLAEATTLIKHHGSGGDARTRVAFQDPAFHVDNHPFSRISLPVLYDSRRCFAAQTQTASNLEQQQAKPRATLHILSVLLSHIVLPSCSGHPSAHTQRPTIFGTDTVSKILQNLTSDPASSSQIGITSVVHWAKAHSVTRFGASTSSTRGTSASRS